MVYCFDSFELDTARVELRAAGVPVAIEPQVFALLAMLIENRERMVSREELIEKVWEGRVVSDSAVASRIKSARQVLGDDGSAQRFIRTVHGKGFRFVAHAVTVRTELSVQETGAASPAPATTQVSVGRPSIAVLPFRILGAAGPYAAFAEALPDDLISELSRLRWLFVTARGSSFRMREPNVDPSDVGRLLGVRYSLSGTIEIVHSRLWVTSTLVDTRDGGVIWSERLAGSVDDVHRIREELCAKILSTLEMRIPLHEAALARLTTTENLDAWSAYHLGLQHIYRFNRTDNTVAAALFQRAIDQDPAFARAHAGISFLHFQNAFMHYTSDPRAEILLARRCAERGLELDPLDPFVNYTMGRTFWLDGNLQTSLTWLERATALSPNYAQCIYTRAFIETMSGRGANGRVQVDHAMQLSPIDPLYYAMLATRGFAHMAMGDHQDAVDWVERGARSPGAHVLIAQIAVVANALAGNSATATAWAENVHARNPALTRADFFRAFPMQVEETRQRVMKALVAFGF